MSAGDEDVRLGRLLRAIRRRSEMTQRELAAVANVTVLDLRRVETGQVGEVRLDRVRRLFAIPGGRARVTVWWNGAAADRLIDERHAALVERVVAVLRRRGWDARVEVSFSEFGERGSIDVFAGLTSRRAVVVFEVKSDVGSLEETNRVFDTKVRLAPKLAIAQFGWRPDVVGRVLVLPEELALRRLVDRHAQTMRAIYPATSRDVRAWLRNPTARLRGIWFLSETRNTRRETG